MRDSITLSQEQLNYADQYGMGRYNINLERGSQKNHKKTNNLVVSVNEKIQMDIEGIRCEYAGWMIFQQLYPDLDIKWYNEIGGRTEDVPDIEFRFNNSNLKIDVKGIYQSNKNLLVSKDKVQTDWIYLLIDGSTDPTFRMKGWKWGHEVLEVKISEPQPNRPGHLIYKRDLNKLDALDRGIRYMIKNM